MALFEKEDNQDLFDAYLCGELTSAEEEVFKTRLEEDSALKQEYTLHLAMVEGIKSEKRAELISKFNMWDEELPPVNSKPRSPYLFYKIAASFIVFLVAGLFFFKKSENASRAAQAYIEEPGLPVLMSSTSDPWAASMNAYRKKNYLKALQQLPKATNSNKDSVSYFKGIFLLKMDKPSEAAVELSASYLSTSVLQDKAAYYHAYALWQTGKKAEAKQEFEAIAQNSKNPFQAEVLEVLKQDQL